ncbi:hypothetical protein BDR06DRAFT_972989 [Suillus hirtellus]|nr:hypothetical protein BDR06DRAFT_972989 [Suillus hirtellus]
MGEPACRHTWKKGNGWAQNVRPDGPACSRIGPADLHLILKIMMDGPKMCDQMGPAHIWSQKKANGPSTYAGGLGNTDGPNSQVLGLGNSDRWAQSHYIWTRKRRWMGPVLLYLDPEKAMDGPSPAVFGLRKGYEWAHPHGFGQKMGTEMPWVRSGLRLVVVTEAGAELAQHIQIQSARCILIQAGPLGPLNKYQKSTAGYSRHNRPSQKVLEPNRLFWTEYKFSMQLKLDDVLPNPYYMAAGVTKSPASCFEPNCTFGLGNVDKCAQ